MIVTGGFNMSAISKKGPLTLSEKRTMAEAISSGMVQACKKIGCDLRCVDWFSYNPDMYIKSTKEKAA